jgi:hypothetical protein
MAPPWRIEHRATILEVMATGNRGRATVRLARVAERLRMTHAHPGEPKKWHR